MEKTKPSVHFQKYKREYGETFSFITQSRKGDHFAFCTICRCDMSIKSGGIHDIKRHVEKEKHKKNADAEKALSSSSKLTSFFKPDDLKVIRAEVRFTDFLVEHNIQPSVADHCGELFKKMFPDSEIAKKYSCGRTKTTHIIKSLADEDAKGLASRMKNHPFSVATDGSTDIDEVKLYPLLVKTVNDSGMVKCELLSIKECSERSTSQNIFNLINSEFESLGIPWKNCLSFATDNASVMVGRLNGVAQHIKEKNPNIYVMGCPCHLMHLAAKKGAKCLAVQVDDMVIDVWYYLDKSSLRKQAIIDLQKKHGEEVRKILKHVSTRWLSLHKAVCRLLDNWDVLEEFFKDEASSHSKKRKAPTDSTDRPLKKLKTLPKGMTTKTTKTSSTSSATGSSLPKSACSSAKSSTTILTSSKRSATTSMNTASAESACSSTSKSIDNQSKTSSRESCTFTVKSSDVPPKTKSSTVTSSSLPKSCTTGPKPEKQFDFGVHIFGQGQYKIPKKKQQETSQLKTKPKVSSVKKSDSTKKVTDQKEQLPQQHKSEVIYQRFKDPNYKLYALFLKSTMPFFDNPNQLAEIVLFACHYSVTMKILFMVLQRDEPQIHILHSVLVGQLSTLLSKFLQPKVIADCADLAKLDLGDESLHRPNEEIQIGYECKMFMNENKDKLNVEEFYRNVKEYYVASATYMVHNYPFNDDLLLNAQVLDIKRRQTAKFTSVEYFVKRFNLPVESMDGLETEFNQYQVDPEIDMLKKDERIDQQWHEISKVKDESVNEEKYHLLSSVMKAILVIFHSNADCERVFSVVGKNKRKERASMQTSTLSALMTHKMSMESRNMKCFSTTYSDEVLRKAKGATYKALHGSSSSAL